MSRVAADRAKETVSKISDALTKVWSRHQAMIRTISGVYREETTDFVNVPRINRHHGAIRATERTAPLHPSGQDEVKRPELWSTSHHDRFST